MVKLLSRFSLVLLMRILVAIMLNCGGGEGSLAKGQVTDTP